MAGAIGRGIWPRPNGAATGRRAIGAQGAPDSRAGGRREQRARRAGARATVSRLEEQLEQLEARLVLTPRGAPPAGVGRPGAVPSAIHMSGRMR